MYIPNKIMKEMNNDTDNSDFCIFGLSNLYIATELAYAIQKTPLYTKLLFYFILCFENNSTDMLSQKQDCCQLKEVQSDE